MRAPAVLICVAALVIGVEEAAALTRDELKLVQDSGGWEYLTMTEVNNGFATQANCFAKAFTGECKGTLIFRPDQSFRQDVSAHGKGMHRGGHYEIQGQDLTFWDEHETKDGPYHITINADEKSMTLETTQAGVAVKIELLLESEFKRQLREREKQK